MSVHVWDYSVDFFPINFEIQAFKLFFEMTLIQNQI